MTDESGSAVGSDEEANAGPEANDSLPEDARTGTFLVTHADDASAVVRDVETAQVHTLASNPDCETGDVLVATIAPEPPLEVTWRVVSVTDRRDVEVVDSDLEPTRRSLEVGESTPVGELTTFERAGRGEVHVLSIPEETVDSAAQEVLADPETVARAARLGAVRVEVRRSAEDGVLSVRYLPE